MRIGIFGGSFNPPHNMHKNIALNLIKSNYVDKVIYVPTGNKYNKKGLIEDYHRYNMIKIMIEGYKNLSVSDYEFNKLTYTYETLDYFKSLYPFDNIYFICGSDNLKEFKTWKNYEYILNSYKILVIKRNNEDIENILKEYLEYKNNIVITDIFTKSISSTQIRNNINNTKNMDKKVYNYIKQNNLYMI